MTTTGSVLPVTSPIVTDLFSEILPSPEEVLPHALNLATEIAENTSTISTSLMKEMMWRGPGSAEGTHLLDSEIMFKLYESADKEKGIKSFLEKRQANFNGSVNSDVPDCVPWWKPINVEKQKKKSTLSRL